MRVEIRHRTPEHPGYRAARTRSLFNAEGPPNFDLDADLDVEGEDWRIGVVVGPSGSGKTSVGRALWGGEAFADLDAGWPDDEPIVEAIDPGGSYDAVTAALGAVGLGDVPAWLRPYRVLSNGERFRAGLARIIAERPERVVIDEFTSVVDRQIARVGAQAFAKSWRRWPAEKGGAGQAVLLTCHYDVLEWINPDWIYDTAARRLEWPRGCLQRPRIEVEIRSGDWSLWPHFKPHHYLEAGPMIAARCWVAFIDGEPVAHLGVGTRNLPGSPVGYEARACRMVVMPEWQGAGVGTRFLDHVCEQYLRGLGHTGKPMTTIFHTSHPGLCAALRRNTRWRQVSAVLHGGNRNASARSITSSRRSRGLQGPPAGYGGHFRAVQGFRYVGDRSSSAAAGAGS